MRGLPRGGKRHREGIKEGQQGGTRVMGGVGSSGY